MYLPPLLKVKILISTVEKVEKSQAFQIISFRVGVKKSSIWVRWCNINILNMFKPFFVEILAFKFVVENGKFLVHGQKPVYSCHLLWSRVSRVLRKKCAMKCQMFDNLEKEPKSFLNRQNGTTAYTIIIRWNHPGL